MLRDRTVPKHLVLKEGAKVIVINNTEGGLYNGMKGVVHKLQHDKSPILMESYLKYPRQGFVFMTHNCAEH